MKAFLTTLLSAGILSLTLLTWYLVENWRPVYALAFYVPFYLLALTTLTRFSYLVVSSIMVHKQINREYDELDGDGIRALKHKKEQHLEGAFWYSMATILLFGISFRGIEETIQQLF